MLRHKILRITILIGLVLGGHKAWAVAADGAGEALNTLNRYGTESVREKITRELQSPLPAQDVMPEYPPESKVQPGLAQQPRFTLKKVNFKGNQVFKEEDLKDLYGPYIGHRVQLLDLKKIAEEITNRYRQEGYFLSYAGVPTQTIKDGIVNIQIFEGYVDRVDIVFEDRQKIPSRRLINLVQKIRARRPIHQSRYERYLMLIRDAYPEAKGYLEPSSTNKDGAASLKIYIPKDAPTSGSFSVHNFGSDTIGPWMQSASLSIPARWNPEDKITANVSKGDTFSQFWSVNLGYEMPIFAEGTTLTFNQLVSRSMPKGKVRGFNIKTRDYRSTLALTHPFVRSPDTNVYGGLELAIQNQRRKYNVVNSLYKERSRNLKVFTIANWKDQMGGSNFMNLAGVQGINMWRAKKESSPNLTREGGASDRFYFEGNVSRMQRISGPFALGFYLMGQYAGNALLDIDRFRTSGMPYNGAYPGGALSGDSGLEGKIEFNYYNYDIGYLKMLRAFLYFSQMKIWNRKPTDIENKSESAKGMGVGTQIIMENGLTATVQYGYPFNSPVGGDSIKPRVGFNLNFIF